MVPHPDGPSLRRGVALHGSDEFKMSNVDEFQDADRRHQEEA
jgi:hypothetical protein